ncbi:MAG: pyridoxal-phosphate-dependent aminotransferase family protein [Planctomycetota bacterium]|jgi:aspartate aminotransferase-like enzyme
MEFGRFFLPGPTEVRPEVLQAMLKPMVAHRSQACADLFARILPPLQALFGTGRTVHIAAASGTAMMEAGVRALPAGARVLSLVNGAFSERYALIADACGCDVERLEIEWGGVHDPDAVADRLKDGGFDAVTMAHSETSTGALQPLDLILDATGRTPLLLDTVSSFAGAALDFDRRGIAYTATGSQKALALPPGLGFAVASQEFMDRAAGTSFYLDIKRYEKNQPPFTPALSLLYALEAQLDRMQAEAPDARFARHRAMAERVWAWAAERGLEILAPEGHRSPTVTALKVPAGMTGPGIAGKLGEQAGYTVATGYAKLKEGTFRIGHMGEQTPETLEGLLAAIDNVILIR